MSSDLRRRSEAIELRPWVQHYARRRYGPATPPAAGAAWQLLLESVYNSTDLHNDHKCARQPCASQGSSCPELLGLPYPAQITQLVQLPACVSWFPRSLSRHNAAATSHAHSIA